jgi:hypothetical protein
MQMIKNVRGRLHSSSIGVSDTPRERRVQGGKARLAFLHQANGS